jgi:hypothetical protein
MSMSSNSYQHRPGQKSRQVGDAPSIGHVPKVGKGTESRALRHTRRRTTIKEPNIRLVLVVSVMLLACGVIVAGLLVWAGRAKGRAAEHKSPAAPQATAPKMAALPLAPAPDEAAATRLVEDFLAARDEAALRDLIRPTDQAPAAMLAKLGGLEARDGKRKGIRALGPMDNRTLQLEGVLVNFEGGRNRLALLAPDASGKWRVDFDAFDRFSTPAWEELLSGKAVTGTVRVFLSPDSYYNGIYGDDAKWACYGIASPDSETLMFGYVPKDGELQQVLAKVLAGDTFAAGTNRKAARMVLEVRHDEKAEKRQFEITRVLSDEWALGDQALDEKLSRPLSEMER